MESSISTQALFGKRKNSYFKTIFLSFVGILKKETSN
jgi:hypothetical protein